MTRVLTGLICGALLLAVVLSILWLIVAAVAVFGLLSGGRWVAQNYRRRASAQRHQRAELLARLELQHRWAMDGDPRGTFGRYPPAYVR